MTDKMNVLFTIPGSFPANPWVDTYRKKTFYCLIREKILACCEAQVNKPSGPHENMHRLAVRTGDLSVKIRAASFDPLR